MKINENFRYAVHIDQWAILEYFKTQEIELERMKNLKGEHYLILGFIVDSCFNTRLTNKEVKGLTYTWMGNSLFFNNLPLTFIRTAKTKKDKKKEYSSLKRNLQNYLNRLIEYDFIYRVIENKTTRYLRVNQRFLTLCNKGENKISPLLMVNKYFKKELQEIEKEYKPTLPHARYESNVSTFFNIEEDEQYIYDKNFDKDNLLMRLRKYLDECVKDPYYENKGS
jgi:hypothetical protein